MDFVKDIDGIVDNLKTLETYLKSGNDKERKFALDQVRNGKTILIYKVEGKNHYAPIRFNAYRDNSMEKHPGEDENDSREMNGALERILKGKAWFLQKKEEEYLAYCATLKLDVPKNERTYWRVGTTSDPYMDIMD
ncbi:MAG: hypothetical protein ACI9YU_001995 [Flavobacteriales bacterium]|jgi:hypothetical protein